MNRPICYQRGMSLRLYSPVAVAALIAGILLPAAAFPQAPGFYATPSFSIAEVFDDNIFDTPSGRTKDFITRITPGIVAGYESPPLTILGGYEFDGEIFADHSELNEGMARQKATLEFRSVPLRPLTLAMKGEYIETTTPGDLNVRTGLVSGRQRADHFLFDPSITYEFDPLTTGTAGYSFSKDDLSGGLVTDTHIARLGLNRRLTRRDIASLEYIFHYFKFIDVDVTRSHTPMLGWTRDVTPVTSFAVRAGPRFSEGSTNAEILASIRHRIRQGEVAFTYARTQTTAVGEEGTVKTDSVTLSTRYRVLPSLELAAAPAYYRDRRGGEHSDVFGAKLEATYDFTRWLSLVASYEYRLQKGILPGAVVAGGLNEDISKNVVFLGLVAKNRFRIF